MMLFRFSILIFFLFASLGPRAEITISSTDSRAHLLELYTSEGCSSCPPADNWLSKFTTHPELWESLVPVAFHVDYWNYIGWEDRFSSPEYSARQRRYASHQDLDTVYTPGFLVNGKEWRGFFKARRLSLENSDMPGTLQVRINNDALTASFNPKDTNSQQDLLLNVAILGFDVMTQVKAGENRNRKLQHNFIVLGYKSVPLYQLDDGYQVMTDLPEKVESAPRTAIAAWINRVGDPEPVQATGGWLN